MSYVPGPIKGSTAGGAQVNFLVKPDGTSASYYHAPWDISEFPHAVSPTPRVRVSAADGLTPDLLDVYSASGGAGGYDETTRSFRCATGTSAYAYGMILSHRYLRAIVGYNSVAEFDAVFPAGVASSSMIAGAFSSGSAAVFGRNGTDYGVMYRNAGALEIRTLTISAASAGSETIDLTLNGTPDSFSIPTTSTTYQTAAAILASVTSTTTDLWDVFQVDDTVIFVAKSAGARSGSYSMTSTGAAAGTLAQNQAGETTANQWISQASWNIDPMDGSGISGVTIDPAMLNHYRISYDWTKGIVWSILDPHRSEWQPVHSVMFANDFDEPQMRDPTMRVGWAVFSEGSTTDIGISGTYCTAYSMTWQEGSALGWGFAATSDKSGLATGGIEHHILSVKAGALDAGEGLNRKELLLQTVSLGINGNRQGSVFVRINGELTASGQYTFSSVSGASVSYACTDADTSSDGRLVDARVVAGSGSPAVFDLRAQGIRLSRGDTVSVSVTVASGTFDTATATVTWAEV